MFRFLTTTALLLLSWPALAQVDQAPTTAVEMSMGDGDYRAKTEDWMIAPGGHGSVGGGFSFMTADGDLGQLVDGPRFKFTDVVFLGLQTRYSLGGIAELSLATTLLPKQPSYTDELVWQSAALGVRVGLTEKILASMHFSGGPTLGDSGGWAGAQLGLGWRYKLDDFMILDGGFHGKGTALFINEEAPWFAEVMANAQIVLPAPGIAAAWVGIEFAFPVASNDTSNFPMDPQTRVNVLLGGVLSFVENWDVYTTVAVIDRGDLVNVETNLPILDGGFDQVQFTLGITHRFGSERDEIPYSSR